MCRIRLSNAVHTCFLLTYAGSRWDSRDRITQCCARSGEGRDKASESRCPSWSRICLFHVSGGRETCRLALRLMFVYPGFFPWGLLVAPTA